MNARQGIKHQRLPLLAGIASIMLAGAAVVAPSAASADQLDGGASGVAVDVASPGASFASGDVDDVVAYRKVAMAQDRVDRAHLWG
jgi:hypothetical protein